MDVGPSDIPNPRAFVVPREAAVTRLTSTTKKLGSPRVGLTGPCVADIRPLANGDPAILGPALPAALTEVRTEAIQTMMTEHRVIERVLDALEAYAKATEQGDVVDPQRLADCVRFFRIYADAIHHGKEEDILYSCLRLQGCPDFEPVLDANQREHETGRNLVDDLEIISRRTIPWSETERTKLVAAARGFVSMLRQHIADEDTYLFPRAVELMEPVTNERVARTCELFEKAHAANKRELEQLAERLAE